MTTSAQLLQDLFDRVRLEAVTLLDGVTAADLASAPGGNNSVAWLLWHTARVQDAQIADVTGQEQVWTAVGWAQRFALPFDDAATGYGQSRQQAAQVTASAELLAGYLEAVSARSHAYLGTLRDADLDAIVDDTWDPPVTLAVRLVSIAADDLQHVGQAAYVLGMTRY
ncbi:uncharacterized protein DUF664 [Branchiibius hedensis]|uniref:DinB-like domain-containing protein n=1 Tax=Branchiibius hedensis TaxID=672460 RepID=A0A2Y8ZPR5_9MICO|nr:DinB family protein [Branchiibius hedensis]PWJ25110.1 uncharacterized protein DUF664 [Branchiibius hedensis]SSA33925.1 Protein of unknown function [Branchiibius hedensis]